MLVCRVLWMAIEKYRGLWRCMLVWRVLCRAMEAYGDLWRPMECHRDYGDT